MIAKKLVEVIVDNKGKVSAEVTPPVTKTDMDNLCTAAARLVVLIAAQSGDTDFVCHPGCTFAAILEQAHQMFHEYDQAEYHRVVEAGILTKAAAAGPAH